MDNTNGVILIREHEWSKSNNVVIMHILSYDEFINNNFIAEEIVSGYYKLIILIPINKVKIMYKYLNNYFKEYNNINHNSYVYNSCIIDLIEPYLQKLNIEYKLLSQDEINNIELTEKNKYK